MCFAEMARIFLLPGFSIHIEQQNYCKFGQRMRAVDEVHTPLSQVLLEWLRIRDWVSVNIEQRWIMLLWIKALI